MPNYTYACTSEHVTDVFCHVSEHKNPIRCSKCRKNAKQIIRAPGGMPLTGWPMASDAMASHPLDIERDRAYLAKNGAPNTEFTPDGRPICRDRTHRNQIAKAYRMHDRDGGYGDASPAS